MSIGDALGFEKFNIGNFFKNLKHDPKRIFLGVDPASTWAWNKVLGRNDKPLVNQLGGPTNETFDKANAQGISTGTASTLHGAAKTVAGALGAYYGGNALGNIGSTSSLNAVGSGAYANGAVADAGLTAAPIAEAGGGATAAPAASSGFDWQSMVKRGMGGQQQQSQAQGGDWYADYLRKQQELQQQAAVRQQLAQLLAQQGQGGPGVTYGPPP